MTDFYAQQYESAGPIARPVVQRSQYLADALRALQNTSENPIRSRGQLAANLLAQALTQYNQRRTQREMQNATEKDAASMNDATVARVRASLGLPPTDAPSPQASNPAALAAAVAPSEPPSASPQLAQAVGGPSPQPPQAPQQPMQPQGATFDVSQWQPPPTGGPNAQGVFYNTAPTSVSEQPFVPPQMGSETMSTNGIPVPPPPPGPPAAGAPPAGPQAPSTVGPAGGLPAQPAPQQQSQFLGNGRVSRQQVESALAMMQSPDPRVQAMGRQELDRLAQLGSGPVEQNVSITSMGQRVTTNPYTGQGSVQDIEGYRVAPNFQSVNGGQVAIDPRTLQASPIPTPQSMQSRPMTAEDAAGLVPGTAGDINPNTGQRTVLQAPPAGFTYQGGRQVPIPGGERDITAPQNATPVILNIQHAVQPMLDRLSANQVNIAAARSGARAQNGSGDIALVNGLQHLIDTGIVRQEDIDNQVRGFGLPGSIASTLQWLRGGGSFTPAQRAQMLRMAEELYAAGNRTYRPRVEAYRPVLDSLGPHAYDTVVPPNLRRQYGWEADPHQRGQGGQTPGRRGRMVGSF